MAFLNRNIGVLDRYGQFFTFYVISYRPFIDIKYFNARDFSLLDTIES